MRDRQYRFLKANALAVDFATKQVHCEAAFEDNGFSAGRLFDLAYDKLIICPGCTSL